jgi:hypothetical protein
MRIRRVLGIGLLCFVVAIAVSMAVVVGKAANAHRRFRVVAGKFDSIRTCDTREAVITILGKPNNHDGACAKEFGPSKDCASELIYSDSSDLVGGNYYVVDFSAHGRVIAAYHFHL